MNRTNNRKSAVIIGVLSVCLLMCQAAVGQPPDPQLQIQEASNRLRTVLQQDGELLMQDPGYVYRVADELLLPNIDMERMSSLVLGRHWREASSHQKQAFSAEFTRLLVRSYSAVIQESGKWEVRFPPSRLQPDSKRTVVQSEVIRPGAQPVKIDYYMYLNEDQWLAYDVKIEGISLVTNYRSSFAKVIRQKGIDGLVAALQAKNDAAAPKQGDRVAVNSNTR